MRANICLCLTLSVLAVAIVLVAAVNADAEQQAALKPENFKDSQDDTPQKDAVDRERRQSFDDYQDSRYGGFGPGYGPGYGPGFGYRPGCYRPGRYRGCYYRGRPYPFYPFDPFFG